MSPELDVGQRMKKLTTVLLLVTAATRVMAHPSDEELLTRFNENRELYGKLASMLEEDSLNQIALIPQFFAYPEIETEIRKNEYIEIMKDLDIAGFGGSEGGPQFITISTETESKTKGSSKGYVFHRQELTPVFDELDTSREMDANFPDYRKIEGGWYLFLMHYDYPFTVDEDWHKGRPAQPNGGHNSGSSAASIVTP